MKYSALTILFCVILISGCASNTTPNAKDQNMHPSLLDELQRIKTVVIIPPIVDIRFLTLTGEDEDLVSDENQIINYIKTTTRSHLEKAGYGIVEYNFDAAKSNDTNFTYTITKVYQDFYRVKSDLQAKRRIPQLNTNSMPIYVSEAIHDITHKVGADAILISRFSGYKKSVAYVAKEAGAVFTQNLLTTNRHRRKASTANGAIIDIALLDGHTGELLWTNSRVDFLSKSLADKALSTLPQSVYSDSAHIN
ncbi:hypothetical protein [Aurantivibrio plasticivorans]